MREARASYVCNFDAKSSSLSNFRCLIVDESLMKSIGWLGPSLKACFGSNRVLGVKKYALDKKDCHLERM